MKQSLPKALEAHYREQSLSTRQLRDLQALHHSRASRSGYLLLAIGLVIGALGAWLWTSQREDRRFAREIALELAFNQATLKTLDVSSPEMSRISAELPDLPFQLTPPPEALPSKYQLEGGRYCTIKGEIAAQLRYVHENEVASLYQTSMRDAWPLPRKHHYRFEEKGYEVLVWIHQGLVTAWIAPANPR